MYRKDMLLHQGKAAGKDRAVSAGTRNGITLRHITSPVQETTSSLTNTTKQEIPMSKYHFCIGCEHITTRIVPGIHTPTVKELSCPARFNPREGKWILKDGVNPHECPRNANFMQIQKQSDERRIR